MKIVEIMRLDKETKTDFFARTYWITSGRGGEKVFIFNNQKEVCDPKKLPKEIWDKQKAIRYLDTLNEEGDYDEC